MKLSIVIPVYNEENRIQDAIHEVLNAAYPENKELIIVNDGSTDKTLEKLEMFKDNPNIKIINQPKNMGKGAALRTGFENVTGDIAIIQDSDLEYTPSDYPKLLEPIIKEQADVVYGSRFLGGGAHRVLYFWHYLGNKFLTLLSNMFTNFNLTDMEVCYKVFKKEVLQKLKLKQNRFGFEPEVTAKIAKLKCRVYEVPISYYGRSYEEGKKIGLKDAIKAFYCIVRYGLFN
ncbi:glycosyltransferase family 2 protein [bacterium]